MCTLARLMVTDQDLLIMQAHKSPISSSDQTRLSVWVLDGDPGHTNLLKFALSEETFPHSLVIFTVAMTTPWGILEQLQNWAAVLGDHIDKLDLTPGELLYLLNVYVHSV